MAAPYFNKDNHPELLSKPLRGKWLEEFVNYSRDSEHMLSLLQPSDGPEESINLVKMVNRAIVENVTKGLNGPEAAAYGIDMNDLKTLISTIPYKDYSRDPDPREAVVINSIVKGRLVDFSKCLAMQQGIEKEYLNTINSSHVETFNIFKDMLTMVYGQHAGWDNQTKKDATQYFTDMIFTAEIMMERLKKRQSPLIDFENKIVFGDKKAWANDCFLAKVEQSIAWANGLDADKAEDREKLRRITKEAVQNAYKSRGLEAPRLGALGI